MESMRMMKTIFYRLGNYWKTSKVSSFVLVFVIIILGPLCIVLLSFIPSYLTALRDLATIISLGVGSFVALKGLSTWREQIHGTKNYELAYHISKTVVRLRKSVDRFRNIFISPGEIQIALSEANLKINSTDPDYTEKSNNAVYTRRWREIVGIWQELEDDANDAEVLWGLDARTKIMSLLENISELYLAYQNYSRYIYGSKQYLTDEEFDKVEKIVYNTTPNKDDEFTTKLSKKIDLIEQIVEPYKK
jgi:hypothetical protein